MKCSKLSVIIPVFNESRTITSILQRIGQVIMMDQIKLEIIIVDDASTDDSADKIRTFCSDNPQMDIRYYLQEVNKGKGAALHRGIRECTGDYLVIQDADLEYDPEEYNLLLRPVQSGNADVVYGSRFLGGNPHRILFFWHSIGNNFLTFLSNMMTNLNLTDMETCYKLMNVSIAKKLRLKEKRFGFEPEVTAKLSKVHGIRIYEVGISYYGRTYSEGKKINWKDGFRAIYCILKYNLY